MTEPDARLNGSGTLCAGGIFSEDHSHDNASPDVLEAAERYIAAGYNIIPVRLDKIPIGTGWTKRAYSRDEVIEALTGGHGGVAIGIVGGRLNRNLCPLDFDRVEAETWFRQECAARGYDPNDCPVAITPGHEFQPDGTRIEGRHRYFTDPSGQLGNSEGQLPDGINVRGAGFVVLPPSPHASGARYRWLPGCSLDDYASGLPVILDFIRDAILAPRAPHRLHTVNGAETSPAAPPERAYPYGRSVINNAALRLAETLPGQRNNQLSIAALQLGHFAWTKAYSEEEAYKALLSACLRNGYIKEHGERGFAASFASAWRKGESDPRKLPDRPQDDRRRPDASPGLRPAASAPTAQQQPEDWPPFDRDLLETGVPAPPFPLQLMPGRWQDWISASAESANCPADYVGMTFLPIAASLIGNGRRARPWDGWSEPCGLFVALVGRPSSGKSPAGDTGRRPLAALQIEANADWDERRRIYERDKEVAKDRRRRWEKDVSTAGDRTLSGYPAPDMPIEAMAPPPPQRRLLFVNDTTPERAAMLSAANPRGMLLLRDELSGWIGGMDRYSPGKTNRERAFWIEAYGARPWTSERVDSDRSVQAEHLLWSIWGGIQPAKLAEMLADDDGMAARFLYSWPVEVPFRQPEADAELENDIRTALGRLRQLSWMPPEPAELPLSETATFVDWIKEIDGLIRQDTGTLYPSWLGKLKGLALRLALILEHLDWCQAEGCPEPAAIGGLAMERAISLLRAYAIDMAKRTFSEATFTLAGIGRKTARWIISQQLQVVRQRDLYTKAGAPFTVHNCRMGRDLTLDAITYLVDHGWLRPIDYEPSGRGGRPPLEWEVSPFAMKLWGQEPSAC
jgi:hypothetical protein